MHQNLSKLIKTEKKILQYGIKAYGGTINPLKEKVKNPFTEGYILSFYFSLCLVKLSDKEQKLPDI